MKRLLGAALAVAAFAATPAFSASLADLHVVSRSTGQRLPVYFHDGKHYVAGQPGERYSVQVVNRSGRRILSVVSVDGINVVSGETATPDQTGYVLGPWQSYDIAGWRKSNDEVAAFYFTALPDSYAARTDRPGDVGVIGVAVFREWTPPRPRPQPYPYPQSRSFDGSGSTLQESAKAERAEAPAADAAAPSASAAPESRSAEVFGQRRQLDKLGTGHGEREQSVVSYTDFRRASAQPAEVITIYYDRYENLLARGIVPGPRHYAQPRPFPGAVRFVPDPLR
jgi:hypothetical protein